MRFLKDLKDQLVMGKKSILPIFAPEDRQPIDNGVIFFNTVNTVIIAKVSEAK
jgi:hypothetical protein